MNANGLARRIKESKPKWIESRGRPILRLMATMGEQVSKLKLKDGGSSLWIGSHEGKSWVSRRGLKKDEYGDDKIYICQTFIKYSYTHNYKSSINVRL